MMCFCGAIRHWRIAVKGLNKEQTVAYSIESYITNCEKIYRSTPSCGQVGKAVARQGVLHFSERKRQRNEQYSISPLLRRFQIRLTGKRIVVIEVQFLHHNPAT